MSSTRAIPAGGAIMDRYHPAMRALHWITAVLVLGMFIVGGWLKYFDPGDGPLKDRLYSLHESTGMLIWVLVLLRIVVRLASGAPKLPAGTPGAVRVLATLNHAALYVVLLVQPVIGLMDTNAWGFPLAWFGLFPVPSPVGKLAESQAQFLSDLHLWGAIALLMLLVLHVAGAAYHGLIRRDGALRHMA